MRAWIDAALSILLAPGCAACSTPLAHPTRSAVCERCWAGILPLTAPLCDRCGDALPSPVGGHLCPRCRSAPTPIDGLRSIGRYEGSLRDIIHALKYDGRRSLAHDLGRLMRRHGRSVLDHADVAVPVPLHAARKRERGFNQAEDLARALGCPVASMLVRTRPTSSQAELTADERRRNVHDAFAVTASRAQVDGRQVVLVDDVMTTGATLFACATALRDAGASAVFALTAARTATRSR